MRPTRLEPTSPPDRPAPDRPGPARGGLDVLFASAMPHLPQTYGGVATNTRELAEGLAARGHRASVLARLSYGNAFGLGTALRMRLRGETIARDHVDGCPVHRARAPWAAAARLPRPDVAVVQDGRMLPMIQAFRDAGVPTVAYFHGLEFEDWTREGRPLAPAELPPVRYLANSAFTAERFRARYGLRAAVIRPVFHPARYRTSWRPAHVTFVNPVPEKGLEIALSVAQACPDIPFVFVKGWPLSPRARVALGQRLRALPNVGLREPTDDMREVYATTRVLLAPSVWDRETWGRVASEAHCSGIPVLGSDRGGLPEAIGPGGLIVPAAAAAERWTEALRRLWSDADEFDARSRAASAYARRADLDVRRQVDAFLAVLGEAVATDGPAPAARPAPRHRARERSGVQDA